MFEIDGVPSSLAEIKDNLKNSTQCLTLTILMDGLIFTAKSWTYQEKMAAVAIVEKLEQLRDNQISIKVI